MLCVVNHRLLTSDIKPEYLRYALIIQAEKKEAFFLYCRKRSLILIATAQLNIPDFSESGRSVLFYRLKKSVYQNEFPAHNTAADTRPVPSA